MKKIITTIVFVLVCASVKAGMKFCGYFDGFWSSWKTQVIVSNWKYQYELDELAHKNENGGTAYWDTYHLTLRGGYGGFFIYCPDTGYGPWYPLFKFAISNYYTPSKETLKQKIQNNEWLVYNGTVEYYVSDYVPSAYTGFKRYQCPVFVLTKDSGRPIRKVTSQATIKIAPYKDHPKIYNIWYDSVGLGIDLGNIYF